MSNEIGIHGNMFGGNMMSLIDEAGAVYACQICDTPRMVTISIDKCFFERPAKEGSLIKIYGLPHKVGTTSITMYMECRAHNVYTGEQKVILRTNIKFVRIDEEGNAIPISDRAKNRITKIINGETDITDKII